MIEQAPTECVNLSSPRQAPPVSLRYALPVFRSNSPLCAGATKVKNPVIGGISPVAFQTKDLSLLDLS